MVKRILFVCSGNQCRSPFAAAVFNHLVSKKKINGFEASSAGTISMGGEPATTNARKVALEIGINLDEHSARPVNAEMFAESDRIIVMENVHKLICSRLCPSIEDKIELLGSYAPTPAHGAEILDPISGDLLAYRTCFSRIVESMQALIAKLQKETE